MIARKCSPPRRSFAAAMTMAALTAAGCAPVAPSPLPPTPPEAQLRLMTYNVLGAQADDAIYSEHRGWAARIDQVVPDLLVVQEVQSPDLVAIVAGPTNEYRVASYGQWACDTKPDPEGVAIVVRSGIDVGDAGAINVGDSCANPSLKRVLVWADVEIDGQEVRVYGTHLSQGGAEFDGSRTAQIRAIRAKIADDAPQHRGRWILAGDLNAEPGDPSYRLMMGTESGPTFVDVFGSLSPKSTDPGQCRGVAASDRAGLDLLLARPELVADCGYTAGWPKDSNFVGCDLWSWCVSWEQRRDLPVRQRIDYVVVPQFSEWQPVRAQVPNRTDPDFAAVGQEWFRLSDHLPLIVDLDLHAGPTGLPNA